MDQSACYRIQRLEVMSLSNADAIRSYYRERQTYIGGRGHSNNCLLGIGPGAPKLRCIKMLWQALKYLPGLPYDTLSRESSRRYR